MLTEAPSSNMEGLYDAIRQAWGRREIAQSVSRAFTATSRGLSIFGLIPGIGTVASAAGLGATAGEVATTQAASKQSWYELGPEILKLESLAALERHIDHSIGNDT